MENRGVLSKILAVAGTVLVGLPIFALFAFLVVGLFSSGGSFLFDYLIPAEVFPVVLCGGLLLLWAAFRGKAYRKPLIWIFVGSLLSLAACQGIAVVSGLADGSRDASGPIFYLVNALIILYDIGVLALLVLGIFLVRKMFSKKP